MKFRKFIQEDKDSKNESGGNNDSKPDEEIKPPDFDELKKSVDKDKK